MTFPVELWPAVATVLAGLVGWLGIRTKSRADKDIANAPKWGEFTDQIQEWTRGQLKERDERIERLQRDLTRINDEMKDWRRKYLVAVKFIRECRRAHPVDGLDIPPEIEQDV